uniref:Sphingomyelin synthase-related protein 1-like n=1 Tax=Saccoglossus kowalevskii TaxID=10224 RepID=A0ABM0MIT8_SACKO|nr:PREDICTED: sphingomyelin synthase-related protein 1-like [Saccoglossus kowalevskii]
MTENVSEWTTEQTGHWLEANGFSSYVELLCDTHKVDGEVLLSLMEDDLRKPPIELKILGDIKKLIHCIRRLQRESNKTSSQWDNGDVISPRRLRSRKTAGYRHQLNRLDSTDSQDMFSADESVKSRPMFVTETSKTVISFVYFASVLMLTAFTMTVVHDRVPDTDKYPPLPDIVLDNLPHIPWAFKVCEIVGAILGTILCVVLVLHKHRLIILRRIFSLSGTIFLLRCSTMFIYGDVWSKLKRSLEICLGLGMSLTGVNTCGDYMFSGHTVVITTFNFFITEYTPRDYDLLHTMSWVLNIFGIFFILAAHEHYSIDVFVAFYITSRLFLYYHSLANNRSLLDGDQRTRVWFPMFSFFESKVDGIVPNEYEWPKFPKMLRRHCD